MSILYTKNHLTMCLSKVILCAYLIIYFIIIGVCNIIKKLHIDMIFILVYLFNNAFTSRATCSGDCGFWPVTICPSTTTYGRNGNLALL